MVWIKSAVRHVAKKAGLLDAPQSHQSSAHWVLSRYVSMDRKAILEVGGSQTGEAALPFLADGAANVVISGLDHVTEEKAVDQKLRLLRANALALSEVFEAESFDVVYGLSIVEHIPSPQVFLNEVHKVLKPGGVAYFEGNPLWSSAKGHHLWVATWGGPYQHKATANYLFSSFPQQKSTNPLPDWSHLLMSRQQMVDHLGAKALPQVDIDCIIDWVYSSDQVNRLSLAEIAKAYSNSKLVVLEANTARSKVPPDVELNLRRHCGDGIDYGTRGIAYVLRKQ
jgi:SAM-dependent methyltransferase